MSKELEALERIDERNYLTEREHREFYNIVEKELKRLETIEQAKPSEALEGLKHIKKYYVPQPCSATTYDYLETIKQTLIKAQEQEGVLKILFEKGVDVEYIKEETTTFEDYNKWIEFVDGMGINIPKNRNRQLTEEEFDLVKRCISNE